jgi:hypothetical protein
MENDVRNICEEIGGSRFIGETARLGQQFSTVELLVIAEHLSICDECREKVKVSLRQRSDENTQLNYDVNPHLVYEDQVKYFTGNLSEERMEYCLNHLLWCEPCRLDLLDFSEFFFHVNQTTEVPTAKNKRWSESVMVDSRSDTEGFSRYTEQFLKFLNE